MTATWEKLLGEKLVQHSQADGKSSSIATSELNGKSVAFYFSAHWCQPCRQFTPRLVKAYQDANDAVKSKLEIVFVSADKNEEDFDEYYKEMPWKVLPFSDRERSKSLWEQFKVDGIPSLMVLSSSLEIITTSGIEEVFIASREALKKWSEGRSLLWSREPREGEHVWKGATCTGCFMNPLLGSRHACPNSECRVNLCEECLSKTKHHHPLIEYLIPTREYSLERLLATIPLLVDPKTNEKTPSKSIEHEGIKSVGFYFSAQWCPPSQVFTPLLSKFYQKVREASHAFDIVFLSCDGDEDSFNAYRSQMPWLAAPFNSHDVLSEYFSISSIPSLIVLSLDGQILSRKGFEAVEQHGMKALETWARGDKLTRPPEDQYKWLHVACDACGINPIVGQRYACPTCGNYDLCLPCQKKGHEHELEFRPQPNDEE